MDKYSKAKELLATAKAAGAIVVVYYNSYKTERALKVLAFGWNRKARREGRKLLRELESVADRVGHGMNGGTIFTFKR